MQRQREAQIWLSGVVLGIVGNLIVSSAFEMIKAHGIELIQYTFFFILSNLYFSLSVYFGGQHYIGRRSSIILAIGWFFITSLFAIIKLNRG